MNLKRRTPNLTALLVLLALGVIFSTPVQADYYKYVNKKGAVCFTDDVNSIPSKYRHRALLIRESRKPVPPPASEQESVPPSAVAPDANKASALPQTQTTAESSIFTWRGVLTGFGLLALAAGAWFLIGVVTTKMGCNQACSIARIIMVVGFLTCLLFFYSRQMVNTYYKIKQEVVTTHSTAGKKTNRIDDALK